MKILDFAKRLRETPMTSREMERYEFPESITSMALRDKIQMVYLPNDAGNIRYCISNHCLSLGGYLPPHNQEEDSFKDSLDLPCSYTEHFCHVLFHQGKLIDLEPEPDNREANFWFDSWCNLACQNDSVREVTCYFNLNSGSVLHSRFQLGESARKPAIWMTTNIANSVLTELFCESKLSVGMVLVYPYHSLVQGKAKYHPGPAVLMPTGKFES